MTTTKEWKELLGKADATHESAERAAARCILNKCAGFFCDDDVIEVATALQAWEELLVDHGVLQRPAGS